MNPEAVSCLKVGDFRDGQRGSGTLDADFYLRPSQVEGGSVGIDRRCNYEEQTGECREGAATIG